MSGLLDNAKVGDKLMMTSRWNRTILTVEKVQKNFVIAKGYKFRKPSGTYQLRLAPICNEATDKGYEFVRVAVNNLTNEVFFVFSETDGLIAKKYDNAPSRISSRDLVMWLEERFDLPKNGGGILLFSDNLSRENGFTYKITAKK